VPGATIAQEIRRLEARKQDLERSLAEAAAPPPSRLRAVEAIRSLVDRIVLTPVGGALAIELRGAAILAFARARAPAATERERVVTRARWDRKDHWLRGPATPENYLC
jgi:hypothetical protein